MFSKYGILHRITVQRNKTRSPKLNAGASPIYLGTRIAHPYD